MNNFKGTHIPDIDNINSEISNKLDSVKSYKIQNFYTETGNKIYKNTEGIKELIDYNSFLNKKSNSEDELKGLYILYSANNKTYVGISRTIFRRLKQHFYGKNHNESTLVYMMALAEYKKDHNNEEYTGRRVDLPYDNYRETIQEEMRKNWEIKLIPEMDSYKLYYMEIYIACKLKSYWNSFETH